MNNAKHRFWKVFLQIDSSDFHLQLSINDDDLIRVNYYHGGELLFRKN